MRQTLSGELQSSETGRFSERPVSTSPIRQYVGEAADGAECLAAINSRDIVLSRLVGGIACRIRIAPSQYLGIAVVNLADGCGVRLVHRDAGLTVDLPAASDIGTAAEQRDRLARLLGLPILDLPALASGSQAGRRAVGHQLKRPRFLKRRRTGGAPSGPRLLGREIIARD